MTKIGDYMGKSVAVLLSTGNRLTGQLVASSGDTLALSCERNGVAHPVLIRLDHVVALSESGDALT